jgi:hypothetical protein
MNMKRYKTCCISDSSIDETLLVSRGQVVPHVARWAHGAIWVP